MSYNCIFELTILLHFQKKPLNGSYSEPIQSSPLTSSEFDDKFIISFVLYVSAI
jgi:hypothetical protein